MANTKWSAITANTAPLVTDKLLMIDDPGGTPAGQNITITNFFKVINGLTADTAPDGSADYLPSYDASASGAKKILLRNAGTTVLETGYLGYLSPADSTTYYYGHAITGSPTTSANTRPVTIYRAGTIYSISLIFVVEGTLATAETFTTSFRLNNTTDTTISAVCKMDAAYQKYSTTGLSIAVASGDTFEIKFVTPAWATNPTDTRSMAVIWMY